MKDRHVKSKAVGLAAAALFLTGATISPSMPAAAQDLSTTHPEHYHGNRHVRPGDKKKDGVKGDMYRMPDHEGTKVLYSVPDLDVSQVGAQQMLQTRFCRHGRFGADVHGRYVVQARNGHLDVAWGNGRNLHDPEGVAEPDKAYMIHMGGTSQCIVYAR